MRDYKTPLRYPGGKSRAVKELFRKFPDLNNYSEFREPFLGGGSVSIAVAKKYPHLDIWVNDIYMPLYFFWKTMQSSGNDFVQELLKIKNEQKTVELARESFSFHKERVNDIKSSEFLRAVSFFVVNKCSFSGLTESSSFSPQASIKNFTKVGINNLLSCSNLIKRWKITNFSYECLMEKNKDAFVYLDPPYNIKTNLYGKGGLIHRQFDHDMFADICNKTEMKMMVSYNADNIVKDKFYEEKWKISEFDHTYTMRSTGNYMENQKKRKELIIVNF